MPYSPKPGEHHEWPLAPLDRNTYAREKHDSLDAVVRSMGLFVADLAANDRLYPHGGEKVMIARPLAPQLPQSFVRSNPSDLLATTLLLPAIPLTETSEHLDYEIPRCGYLTNGRLARFVLKELAMEHYDVPYSDFVGDKFKKLYQAGESKSLVAFENSGHGFIGEVDNHTHGDVQRRIVLGRVGITADWFYPDTDPDALWGCFMDDMTTANILGPKIVESSQQPAQSKAKIFRKMLRRATPSLRP